MEKQNDTNANPGLSGFGAAGGSVGWPDRAGIWWGRDNGGQFLCESFMESGDDDVEIMIIYIDDTRYVEGDLKAEFVWLGIEFPSPNDKVMREGASGKESNE